MLNLFKDFIKTIIYAFSTIAALVMILASVVTVFALLGGGLVLLIDLFGFYQADPRLKFWWPWWWPAFILEFLLFSFFTWIQDLTDDRSATFTIRW